MVIRNVRPTIPTRENSTLQMADPVPITGTAIKLEMPVFNANVQTWFLQLDAIFQTRHITSQQSKFAAVVEKLPTEVAAEVADILTSLPVEKPYETLKRAILHRSGFSEEKKDTRPFIERYDWRCKTISTPTTNATTVGR